MIYDRSSKESSPLFCWLTEIFAMVVFIVFRIIRTDNNEI